MKYRVCYFAIIAFLLLSHVGCERANPVSCKLNDVPYETTEREYPMSSRLYLSIGEDSSVFRMHRWLWYGSDAFKLNLQADIKDSSEIDLNKKYKLSDQSNIEYYIKQDFKYDCRIIDGWIVFTEMDTRESDIGGIHLTGIFECTFEGLVDGKEINLTEGKFGPAFCLITRI